MKEKLILLLFLLTNFLLAQNVIIIVIDGARYTETFDSAGIYIPHMYNDLKPSGYLYTNFRIADEGKTETNPGHASMLTGTWQQIANDGSERPTKPTTFEYFRKELDSNLTDAYIIGGKAKLGILAYSTDPDYGLNYRASIICADVSDNIVYDSLVSNMNRSHPNLVLVSFSDTDRGGHSGVWSNYVNALTKADSLVYEIWQHIQAGDYGYSETNTTLFVTNDHGRHDDAHGGFKNHGDDCEGCEHIMLLAIGRNVTPGIVNNDLHHQIDIAPTVGDLLNFSTPQSIGTSLYEGGNPLPVELSSFSAVLVENTVRLSWVTKTEVNNFGFEVQKSENRSRESDWIAIGFVEGNGNSNSPKDYSFIDEFSLTSVLRYRLKQIDTDGNFEYSKIIEVDLSSPGKLDLSQNFPNPFNPSTTISFSLPQSGNVKLAVYNIIGEQIAQLFTGFKEAGIYSIIFNASELNSGIYVYRLEAGNISLTKKMIVLK